MILSQAERQLIGVIRRHDAQNFTLTIHVDNDRFDIRLEDHDIGKLGTGSGTNFDTAWHDIDPLLRQQP